METITKETILREKAKRLRYKKPLAYEFNLEDMRRNACDWLEECSDVHWAIEKDGYDALCDLLGDEDDAAELQTNFAALEADVERFTDDLDSAMWAEDDEINRFLVCAGVGDHSSWLGYDSYEEDYFPIDGMGDFVIRESRDAMKKITKERLFEIAQLSMGLLIRYTTLKYRHDMLQSSLEIIKDEYGHHLDVASRIMALYDALMDTKFEHHSYDERRKAEDEMEKISKQLPDSVWLQ